MSPAPVPLLRSAVHGQEDLWDPAETFHEASRLYPSLGERQAAGIARLAASPGLQDVARLQRRNNPQLPSIGLQAATLPPVTLAEALARRRSEPPSRVVPIPEETLAALLDAAYGAVADGRRAVPSGGALYPLELFVVARAVSGVDAGVWHLDPRRLRLERLPADEPDLADAVPLVELVEHASAVVFIAATFWRTRFKYGLRGYRFALLEAGHAAQNLVLAAAAFGLAALPLGGFYDAKIDALLGLDGVDQSVLYGIVLGGERP